MTYNRQRLKAHDSGNDRHHKAMGWVGKQVRKAGRRGAGIGTRRARQQARGHAVARYTRDERAIVCGLVCQCGVALIGSSRQAAVELHRAHVRAAASEGSEGKQR